METRLNIYQLGVLEYELERYPDIVPIALRKIRLKSVAELTGKRFDRFFHVVQTIKSQKYGKKPKREDTHGTDDK